VDHCRPGSSRRRSARKLEGQDGYGLRVGSSRVLYDVDKQKRLFVVCWVKVRKDAYREPARSSDCERVPVTIDQRQILTAFAVDNPDLERLETLLGQFNIFEAVGVARQELRHSDFLAFLLDPRKPHGLGDTFAKRFLQQVLMNAEPRRDLSPIDIDAWSLGEMTVQREWRNIDILLLDEGHRLVATIENKIASGEHSSQLDRYRGTVEKLYSGWRPIFVYLTPDGDEPTDKAYAAVDYGVVCDLVERLAETRQAAIDPAVHTMMMHYGRMLRRHVVAGSEIAELCRRIYRSHQQALDLIFEHRPDEQAIMALFLAELVKSESGRFMLRQSNKQSVQFTYREWDQALASVAEEWHQQGGLLYFEFRNFADKLALWLVVGPGPQELRNELISSAWDLGSPFVAKKKETTTWKTIVSLDILRSQDYASLGLDDRQDRTRVWWDDFLDQCLFEIVANLTPAVERTARLGIRA
jgi:hypothetical protein